MTGSGNESGERCVACGEPRAAFWRAATSSEPELSRRASYRLLRCESCGTAQVADADGESESPALYAGGAYSEPGRGSGGLASAYRRLTAAERERLLGGLPPKARVFEIGTGRGELLRRLAERGHSVAGVEPAAARRSVARAAGGEVLADSLQAAEPDGPQDLVVLWHVVEHLDDPEAALRRVAGWLAPQGKVVIAVPDLGSLQARLGGDRWFQQDVPRHRTLFTRTGLARLLGRTGLDPGGPRQPLVDQGPLGMWLTMLNRLTSARDVPFRFAKGALGYERRADAVRDGLVSVVAGPLLAPVALAAELAAVATGRGGSFVIEGRPSGAPREGPSRG